MEKKLILTESGKALYNEIFELTGKIVPFQKNFNKSDNTKHAKRWFRFYKALRKKNKYCDIRINVSDFTFMHAKEFNFLLKYFTSYNLPGGIVLSDGYYKICRENSDIQMEHISIKEYVELVGKDKVIEFYENDYNFICDSFGRYPKVNISDYLGEEDCI
jgi:hypothetical protein